MIPDADRSGSVRPSALVNDLIRALFTRAGGRLYGEFNISQMTARKVLGELRKNGLAAMYPGVGTFVTKLPEPPAEG